MRTRQIPEMRSNLEERIIAASYRHERQGRSGLGLWLRVFRDCFVLPQPAFVMATVLMIGLLLGTYQSYLGLGSLDDDTISASEFVYTASDIGEGDWL